LRAVNAAFGVVDHDTGAFGMFQHRARYRRVLLGDDEDQRAVQPVAGVTEPRTAFGEYALAAWYVGNARAGWVFFDQLVDMTNRRFDADLRELRILARDDRFADDVGIDAHVASAADVDVDL